MGAEDCPYQVGPLEGAGGAPSDIARAGAGERSAKDKDKVSCVRAGENGAI